MAADPSSFDHYRQGEPYGSVQGDVDNTGFDYYRRGEPFRYMVEVAAAEGAPTLLLRMLVGLGS